jgi:LysM repeat protein
MKLWLITKIIAGLAVAGVMTFTAMLAYHIAVSPLGWLFETLIPEAGTVLRTTSEEDFAKLLEASEMPDFEPGDRAYEKANELIALGDIEAGREKMLSIVNVFPNSPAAPTARRIVGMMNLDELLSGNFPEGKTTYEVKSGDSYFAIAGRNDTTLDMIMHLNGMMKLKNLQPGDELTLMPLNLRLLINPDDNTLSLWDGPRFICDYPILALEEVSLKSGKTTIATRRSNIDGESVLATADNYRSASRRLLLASPAIQIMPYNESDETPDRGIYLKEADIEELFLLTRVGNTVEIKATKK